ncbi:hypothetical protein N9152_00180 [bacterium]|nr:hypothetical protein [bacterium]|tara:strand:+ start:359 stop:568 length:210 start_codon:yes stop_codon:yes gene_type:complete
MLENIMSDEENAVTSIDAINAAVNGDVAAFKNVVNDLLMDKIKDSIEIKTHDVSTNFMSAPDADQEPEE